MAFGSITGLPPTPHSAQRTSVPSRHELQRLQARLAFYEQPMTAFDCPVENDPSEPERIFLRSGVSIVQGNQDKRAKKVNKKMESHKRDCVIERLVDRGVAFVRDMLPQKRDVKMETKKTHKKKKRCAFALFGSGGIHGEIDEALNAAQLTPSRGRVRHFHHNLDDATRFRLELAGMYVQDNKSAMENIYTVCV